MKISIDYLPQHKQAELKALVDIVRNTVPAEMIILFGSYARGSWVEDKYDDDHYRYQSDYDVLVQELSPTERKRIAQQYFDYYLKKIAELRMVIAQSLRRRSLQTQL